MGGGGQRKRFMARRGYGGEIDDSDCSRLSGGGSYGIRSAVTVKTVAGSWIDDGCSGD